MAEVDISIYHFRHELRDLALIGSWARVDDGQWRRCLVIMRKWAYGSDDMRIYVVFDDVDLPNWALDAPPYGDTAWAVAQGRQACKALDINESRANINLIITAVNDSLYDLIMMPPRPAAEKVTVGEVVMTDRESGRRLDVELRTDV